MNAEQQALVAAAVQQATEKAAADRQVAVDTAVQNAKAQMEAIFANRLTTLENQMNTKVEEAKNAAAAAGGGDGRRGATQKIASFTNEPGDDDWVVFRKHFSDCAALNGYNDQQKRLALSSAMKGKAALATLDINVHGDTQTFDEVLRLYEERFLPASASQLSRTTFDHARQNPKEKVLEYHGRLRALHNRAYPNATDDTLLIRKFVLGLKSKELRMQAMRAYPNTYAEALTTAQNEASVQQLVAVSELGAAVNQGEPMEIGAMEAGSNINGDRKPGKCHFCNKMGHWKRDCMLLKRAQKAKQANQGKRYRKEDGRGQGGRPGESARKLIAALDVVEAALQGTEEDDEGGSPHEAGAEDSQGTADF